MLVIDLRMIQLFGSYYVWSRLVSVRVVIRFLSTLLHYSIANPIGPVHHQDSCNCYIGRLGLYDVRSSLLPKSLRRRHQKGLRCLNPRQTFMTSRSKIVYDEVRTLLMPPIGHCMIYQSRTYKWSPITLRAFCVRVQVNTSSSHCPIRSPIFIYLA